MALTRKPVVAMRWLAEGQPDPHPQLCDTPRENLAMADWSDDELGYYAFMNYDRSLEEETRVCMSWATDEPIGFSKIAFMTALQERVRWLSRQLAIAQGIYPGRTTQLPVVQEADPATMTLEDRWKLLFDKAMPKNIARFLHSGERLSISDLLPPDPAVREAWRLEALNPTDDSYRYLEADCLWGLGAPAMDAMHEPIMPERPWDNGVSSPTNVEIIFNAKAEGVQEDGAKKPESEDGDKYRERRAGLEWMKDVKFFFAAFGKKQNEMSLDEIIKAVQGVIPGAAATEIITAMGRDVVPACEVTRGAGPMETRLGTYHDMVRAMCRAGKYIPCNHDVVIERAGESLYEIGHSLVHKVGQLVKAKDVQIVSETLAGIKQVSPKTAATDELEGVTDADAHSVWFREIEVLYTRVGISALIADLHKAVSRICRLIVTGDKGNLPLAPTMSVRTALGMGGEPFIERLKALRKVTGVLYPILDEMQKIDGKKLEGDFAFLDDPKAMASAGIPFKTITVPYEEKKDGEK